MIDALVDLLDADRDGISTCEQVAHSLTGESGARPAKGYG